MEIELDLRESIAENAKNYYEKAKKAERKVSGAKKALKDTVKKREALESQREKLVEEQKEKPEKKRIQEKKWYEIFRYFTSSDDFFVIGGRDATTNDIIIKKHMEKNDLIFHADITGAPFFIIKNPENKKIPENTIRETAEMAASYSKAWGQGMGSCNVYYVTPEQVSKTPKAGEYLGKGAFMIYGKKEWARGTELRIAVGFRAGEEIEVIGGPQKTRKFPPCLIMVHFP